MTSDLNKLEFLSALETDLRLRGLPFARRDLQEFVGSVWGIVEAEPDVGRWAGAFAEAMRLDPRAGSGG